MKTSKKYLISSSYKEKCRCEDYLCSHLKIQIFTTIESEAGKPYVYSTLKNYTNIKSFINRYETL